MSNIVPAGKGMPANIPESFSRNEGRILARRQNAEVTRGLVVATRVQAAGHVAATGMQMTAMLSREAAFLADGDPQTAARLNFIVDSFADNAAWEVRQFRG
ncbi:hypothetical protein [Glutamicibacter sp. BW77]|uniref:hypothetical protein n=1 Tax=Glutamicibacter TaxID=1742989 RepID=UPI00197AFF8D|nr:hypothetical protein [Glutamicibacter sp. BW77]